MSRKNIILTLWLISPIAVFTGLYALIFVTQDKDKLMQDAVPIGAGAGDTGNANAIGEWLSGHNPDAISLGTRARRERLMIDPRDWPGGIRLEFQRSDSQGSTRGSSALRLELRSEHGTEAVPPAAGPEGSAFVVTHDDMGDGTTLWMLRPDDEPRQILLDPRIPPRDLQINEPMRVQLRVD